MEAGGGGEVIRVIKFKNRAVWDIMADNLLHNEDNLHLMKL